MRELVLIALVGCGRISFDPRHDGAIDDGASVIDQRPADGPVDVDLLFHLSFENGLGDDARGHPTSCDGPCPMLVSGHVGISAALFGGNSCIEIPDAADLHPATYTFAVWAAIPVPTMDVDLIARPLNGATGFIDGFEMWVQPDSGVVILANSVQRLTTGLDVTQWHHYVGIYDGNAMVSYVDGSLVGADSGTSATMYGPDSYLVGCDHDNGVAIAKLSGSVDDVRFYGRALSATEVAALTAGI